MIFGCGIDIEETGRFNKHYFHKGKLSGLMYDIFTSKEIENFLVFGKKAFLKGFSFKEAFYKALNCDIHFKDIEIIFKDDRNVKIYKSEKVKNIFEDNSITDIKAEFKSFDKYVISKVLLFT